MQKPVRLLVALALTGAGLWIWRAWFPGPQTLIRRRLVDLARTVSFERGQGNIRRIYRLQKLPDFFTTNVTVSADVPGHGRHSLQGRDELVQAAEAAQQRLEGLHVEFVDIQVTVTPDRQTATVDLTAKITTAGERDFTPQEFNLSLRKVDGKWLIYKIETVKVLSAAAPVLPGPG